MKLIYAVDVALLALVLYMYYPSPSLPPRVKNWQSRGTFFNYKEFKIFNIDEVGQGGNEEILICLHGFPTSSYDWVKVHGEILKLFGRVIFLDFLGYGFSDKPRHHTYSILEQADIVESLLTFNGISHYHILAHDVGNTVGLELLARQKKNSALKIKSFTMMNGGIFPETNNPRPIQKILLIPILGCVISKLGFYQLFRFTFGETFGSNKPTDEDYKDFWSLMEQQHGTGISHRLLKFIPERTTYKDRWVGALKKTSLPVLFIYGPADPINTTPFIDHYMKLVPQHKISVLGENIGHYPQWEDPENVMQEYKKFLKNILP